MPTLHFVVEPSFVATHAIAHPGFKDKVAHPAIAAFQARHRQGSSRTFSPARFTVDPSEAFRPLLEDPLFSGILAETEATRELVRSEWERNVEKTSAWMRELTGLALDGHYTVLLTHPAQNQGRYLGNNKIAWCWSDAGDFSNTVYLWHEILHSVFPKSDRAHALIELMTDNELWSRLNGGKYPPWRGHRELDTLRAKMLDAWRDHLREPGSLDRLLG